MTAPPDATARPDAGAPPRENWFDRPMRWAQLTLAENDPGQYDVRFWLDYFKEVRADAACLSAGGLRRLLPHQIPLHYRSPFLGDRDAFGELYEGCRRLGMNVIARTDPHAVHDDVYAAHPDWIMVTADGRPPAPLGRPRAVGHLRPRPLQLRVHDRGHARDRDACTRSTASSPTAGRATASATATTAGATSRTPPATTCPAGDDRRSPARKAYLGWCAGAPV